ncbi:MAG: cation-transporting P-type ATPase [Pseudomonadota bacterium]
MPAQQDPKATGLSSTTEAAIHAAADGPNALKEGKRISPLHIFLGRKIHHAWTIPGLAAKRFLLIDGTQWAGAFAFNAFFSLFPLMILLVTIVSSFVDKDLAGKAVIAYMESYVPISRKSLHHLSEGLRHVERGLRGVWRNHGVAAVGLCFRMHFHLRRLPVRGPGRNSFRTGKNSSGTGRQKGCTMKSTKETVMPINPGPAVQVLSE